MGRPPTGRTKHAEEDAIVGIILSHRYRDVDGTLAARSEELNRCTGYLEELEKINEETNENQRESSPDRNRNLIHDSLQVILYSHTHLCISFSITYSITGCAARKLTPKIEFSAYVNVRFLSLSIFACSLLVSFFSSMPTKMFCLIVAMLW